MKNNHLFVYSVLVHAYCSEAWLNIDPHCFRFTWLGPMYDEESKDKTNCTNKKYTGTPCIEPLMITKDSQPPNTSDLWNEAILSQDPSKISKIACPLRAGSCIKYTYIYNKAILNISFFCGKMIEDQTYALTDGCFVQEFDGHTIEACACKSERGLPCNNSFKITTLSTLLVFTSIIIISLS